MISALLHLLFWSWVNRTKARLRRLKQPKYLLGAIVGGAYFYFYFFRFLLFSPPSSAPTVPMMAGTSGIGESLAAVILLALVLAGWFLPSNRAALVFTEAEIQFLFPAPISRRGLIHYKLLKSQLAILFATLILALVSGRFRGGSGGLCIYAGGWWVMLSTLSLHSLGASFVLTMLFERGISNWRRRLVILGAVALAGAGLFIWTRQSIPPPAPEKLFDIGALTAYLEAVCQFGPVPWLLLPFRVAVRPFLAPDAGSFALALGPALLLLALHYVWVVRSNVAFEEASLELSRRMAEQVAAIRAGTLWMQPRGAKARRAPFELGPQGPPAVAFLWKNLISLSQGFHGRFWLMLAIPLVVVAVSLRNEQHIALLLVSLITMLGIWSLLLGPQVLRQDLRQDLPAMDVLKTYPMPGWQVVLGELLAPAVALTALQWGAVLLGIIVFARVPGEPQEAIPLLYRLAFGAGVAVLLPGLNLIALLIPNAAVLVFPAWFRAGKDAPHGIEATGQNLIYMIGQMLAFLFSLLAPAIAFAVVYFLSSIVVGRAAAVLIASLGAAGVLLAEVFLAVHLLGRVFEKYDVSAEPAV